MPIAPLKEPCLIVIFGASGDLTQRKLIPSLFDLDQRRILPDGLCILGVSRSPMSDDQFRERCRVGASQFSASFTTDAWASFARRMHYCASDAATPETIAPAAERMMSVAREHGIQRGESANILFYLSVSPSLYEPIIESIGASGLITEGQRWCSLNPRETPWQRIIVEKPFGYDLATTVSLNRCLGRVFEEDAIFRIDHYLGKELVQNIFAMRFANSIFEPLWNRTHVDHVQVTAAETVGVGSRAANYYDGPAGGALRDMVQSHLLQVLALVAIEPPARYDASAIMREKIKLFQSAEHVAPGTEHTRAVFGRYGGGIGLKDPAYVEEPGVDPDRHTETYAAIKVKFDNWRWNGVPFFLRSGKKMAAKLTEVVVQFKAPPTNLFKGIDTGPRAQLSNRIIISIAPWEGLSIRVQGKVPGGGLTLNSAHLDLDYAKTFGGEPIEAYGPLILDAIRGDRTLYKHRDEVEASWEICEPFLRSEPVRRSIETYEQGSWGPAGADALIADGAGRRWHNPRGLS